MCKPELPASSWKRHKHSHSSRVQCKQAKKMVSSPLSMCCASSACGFLWVGRWPVETTQVCTSVCAKLVCFSSILFSSPIPLLRPAAAGGPKREPSRESHITEGAAFSLLLALAVGNEVQGELLLPPLLICQGCVLLGS